MDNQVVQNSSNYKTFKGNLSKYRYHRVPLANLTSNQVTLSVASSQLMEFRIGAGQVFNLGKSFISYNYGMIASSGDHPCVHQVGSDFCNWVSFGDGANVNLCDIQYADRYLKVVRPLRTGQDEYESLSEMNMNNKSHLSSLNNVLPFSRDGTLAGLQNQASMDNDEMAYLTIGSSPNQIMTVHRMLPLSAFKDTFIGSDKNIVFATDMYLKFNSQHANKIGFYTTSADSPHIEANLTEVVADDIPNFFNVYLYLAHETNDQLIQAVKAKMMGDGIRLTIPFQYAYRHSTQAGSTTSNVQITLTRQFGRKLKRIITAPFNGRTEKNAYTYDHCNTNGSKVKTVRSSLDSVPLQDYELNCYNPTETMNPGGFTDATATTAGDRHSDDYREQYDSLIGSSIPTYEEYQTNWFHQDLFGVNPMLGDQSVPDEMIDDGLSLDQQKVYALQFDNAFASDATANYGSGSTNSGIIAYYTFVEFLRDAIINSQGVSWV